MTKLTALAEMHLRNVYAADQAHRGAKASIKAWAKEQTAERERGYQAQVDIEIRLALNAGVPKSQILETGLSTKSWNTLYASLKRTAAVAADLDGAIEEPMPDIEFARNDDGTITLSLRGEPFEKSAKEHGWSAAQLNGDALHVWSLDGEGFPIAETDFLPEFGKRHPVGAWHVRNLKIARDWAANN